ncbi:MAG: trehalase family glycosidase [Actinomycetota bacterium]|nr:trehalase family glycosidase [Actinomycetota bacterium]
MVSERSAEAGKDADEDEDAGAASRWWPATTDVRHAAGSGFGAESAERGGRILVDGTSFAVSGPGGDIDGSTQGLFVRDARIISRWSVLVDGARLDPLGGYTAQPFAGVFVARSRLRDGHVEATVLVERRRYVASGMREDLSLRNYGSEPAGLTLTLEVAADFADLFAVKAGRKEELAPVAVRVSPASDVWSAAARHGQSDRGVKVVAPGAVVAADSLTYKVVIPAHGEWTTSVAVVAQVDGEELPMRFPLGVPVQQTAPAREIAEWHRTNPTLHADSLPLTVTVARSEEDLAALRLSDPDEPDLDVVAAGAPWFMALFGRDSLITSWLTLSLDLDLALGTLRALARHQGRSVDPLSEEEPGRILHELRFGADVSLALGGAERYYGSVDATPLFVVVLGQLARWGADPDAVAELLPAADAALEWICDYGDKDGDGYVEYLRSTDRGLRNQGWKDSSDGVNYADGTVANPPVALVEVQAYVYAAYVARAELAARRGDTDTASHWSERASTLKRRFNADFWLPERGWFAVGLDAEKKPIDALASNMGHALWAGAVDADKAPYVAERLVSPELFSGYGIRTLATTMGAYNPASYHNGSVWPHDTALCVAGLMRYGFTAHAQRVAAGLIEAAAYFSGRLPELFCGFGKEEVPGPVPYPAAGSPQAWASAAPIGILAALLGIEPDVPGGTVRLAPALPPAWGAVELEDVPVGGERMNVVVRADGTFSWTGAPSLEVRTRTSAAPSPPSLDDLDRLVPQRR